MRALELRRHAPRDPSADALSPAGRVLAEDVGRTLADDYAAVFVSPARRAAETAAWFLRASGQPLPEHAVVAGLASEREAEWRAEASAAGTLRIAVLAERAPGLVAGESARLAAVVGSLFERIPDHRRALAVGHTPLIEAAVYGLLNLAIEPLAECEGVHLTRDEHGGFRLQERRLANRVARHGD